MRLTWFTTTRSTLMRRLDAVRKANLRLPRDKRFIIMTGSEADKLPINILEVKVDRYTKCIRDNGKPSE